MALTTCPDCANQYDETAPYCPNCGRPNPARQPTNAGSTPPETPATGTSSTYTAGTGPAGASGGYGPTGGSTGAGTGGAYGGGAPGAGAPGAGSYGAPGGSAGTGLSSWAWGTAGRPAAAGRRPRAGSAS